MARRDTHNYYRLHTWFFLILLPLAVRTFGVNAFLLQKNHRGSNSLSPSPRQLCIERVALPMVQGSYDSNDNIKLRHYSPEELEAIQRNADLVSIVENYQPPQFRRTSENRATCLCPFHDDNNPSLSIDGNRGIYKCFSCGAGGNAFTFVREMAKLNGEDLSFPKAVQMVKEHISGDFNFTATTKTSSNIIPLNETSDRVLLANLAASAFFEQNLASLASAGLARSYLRSRELTPRTVKNFGIGYAPDAYFGHGESKGKWGEGSLVQHLEQKGFTIAEMIEAGLVSETRRGDKNQPPTATTVMDRFRGRLVLPIFDTTGRVVLGFGSRTLQVADKESSEGTWKEAKYINSPDSIVFQKKNILFGAHSAGQKAQASMKSSNQVNSVVIVEGYLDAVALWQAGITEVTACMGTSLTSQQLAIAAETTGQNGRVILCLDNDTAGLAAVERLCASSLLFEVSNKNQVEIQVASLPQGTKDPAEFCEGQDSKSAGKLFRAEILEKSIPWEDWYCKRLEEQAQTQGTEERDDTKDNVFNQFASFMSKFEDIEKRKEYCRNFAATLSDTKEGPSEATRTQIESMLLARSEALRNRKDSAITSRSDERSKLLARMAPKSDPRKLENLRSADVTQQASNRGPDCIPDGRSRNVLPSDPNLERHWNARGRNARPSDPSPERHLTPHFAGFSFQNPNDSSWMEDSLSNGGGNKEKSQKPVYFNSNEYHGNRFLSTVASRAGYDNAPVEIKPDTFAKGIGTLLIPDHEKVQTLLEDELLATLRQYPESRQLLREVALLNKVASIGQTVDWTSTEKEQYFNSLLDPETSEVPSLASPLETPRISACLSELPEVSQFTLPDPNLDQEQALEMDTTNSTNPRLEETPLVPGGALAVVPTTLAKSNRKPSLEQLRTRVQEAYYNLLLSTALSKPLPALPSQNNEEGTTITDNSNDLIQFQQEVMACQKARGDSVALLTNIIRGFSSQLVEQAALSISKEGHPQKAYYHGLADQLDEHMDSFLGNSSSTRDAAMVEDDMEEDEPYEDVLEQALEEWGDLYYDDRHWQPTGTRETRRNELDVPAGSTSVYTDSGEDESLEDFDQRIQDDWGWL